MNVQSVLLEAAFAIIVTASHREGQGGIHRLGQDSKLKRIIAKPATECRGKGFAEPFRCRDWQDSSPNI